ncbi:MAG TPA: glycosyltransferase family 9 protein [Acetobacteraceae bacterium]|nr:glycosyltransferase family 9 protein [Acetobacteraceae bacterium]
MALPHRPRRLAILNGFGMTLGDSVIGLTALAAVLGAGRFAERRPLLVRKPLFGRRLIHELYATASPFADVTWFPYRAALAPPFEMRIDIREFAFDPAFRATSMIDYFLTRLGVDPAGIPAGAKRNTWLAATIRPRRPAGLPRKYVLVCPRAAMAMRTMPAPVHARLLASLLAVQTLPVVTQGRPAEPHPRILYCPAVPSLAELAGLVAGAALIVSTDTAMVHLADAWSVPTLAFFITHRPEWRARDYPLCTAIHLPAPLPQAIEFARDAADIAAAEGAWTARGPDLPWLEPALAIACTGRTA